MKRLRGTVSRQRLAFTLIELMVVIAIIAILAAILVPALGNAKRKSQGVTCLSNLRQLQVAWHSYPAEHDNELPPNNDQPDAGRSTNYPSWVAGWLRLDNESGDKTDGTNTDLLIGKSYAAFGSLGPYTQEPRIYKCALDKSTVKVGGQSHARVRTISMNAYMNGEGVWDDPDYVTFRRLEEISNPSGMWVFVEEREDSINDGYFAVKMREQYAILDTPANYHDNGCTSPLPMDTSSAGNGAKPRPCRRCFPAFIFPACRCRPRRLTRT